MCVDGGGGSKGISRITFVVLACLGLLFSACGTTEASTPLPTLEYELSASEDSHATSTTESLTSADSAPDEPAADTSSTIPPTPVAEDGGSSGSSGSGSASWAPEPAFAPATSTWVAEAKPHVQWLQAYDAPGGTMIDLPFGVPNPHQFGGVMTLMVTEGQPGDGWLKVQLPIRPNGQEGWINEQDFTFTQTTIRAEVDLSNRSVVVYDGTRVLAQTQAVIGSSATPTPVGTFYVTAKKRNQESYLGPWALALSSFSEVHETFAGGLPVIAIHGTSRPDQVGQSQSNGCLRIPNDIVTFLAETVPLGAPVHIRA